MLHYSLLDLFPSVLSPCSHVSARTVHKRHKNEWRYYHIYNLLLLVNALGHMLLVSVLYSKAAVRFAAEAQLLLLEQPVSNKCSFYAMQGMHRDLQMILVNGRK